MRNNAGVATSNTYPVTGLVLALLGAAGSLFGVVPLLLAITGLVLSIKASRDPAHRGIATAGTVIAGVAIAVNVAVLAFGTFVVLSL